MANDKVTIELTEPELAVVAYLLLQHIERMCPDRNRPEQDLSLALAATLNWVKIGGVNGLLNVARRMATAGRNAHEKRNN